MILALMLTLIACDDTNTAPEAPAAETPPAAHTDAHTEPAPAEAAAAGEWSHYGAPFTLTSAKPATEVLGAPAQFADQTVQVEGKVTDVCQKAGCWMVITDDERTMRVLMKDHAFSVDKGGTGALCRVEGQIIAKEIDPEEVAHFASESANADQMPEKQATDNTIFELHATGVAMKPAG